MNHCRQAATTRRRILPVRPHTRSPHAAIFTDTDDEHIPFAQRTAGGSHPHGLFRIDGGGSPPVIDDASLTLGTVLVQPAAGPIATRSLPTSVDILGAERIQNQVVTHNWQLFAQMPGVMVTSFNQGNVSGKFSMRGFNGEGEINAVKLLLDGVPGNSNDGNMPYLELAIPLEIEAIEVVRGTNDPRYGLHNIAGNADVITRTGGNYLLGRISYGSFNTRDTQAALGFERRGFSQNYAVSVFDSKGYRDHSDTEKLAVSGKWFWSPGGTTRFGVIARHQDARADEAGYLTRAQSRFDEDMSPAHNASDGGDRTLDQFSAHADVELGDRMFWSTKAYLNKIDDRRFVRFSAGVSQQERYTKEDHIGVMSTLTWRPQVSWAHELALIGGVSAEWQDNTSERYATINRQRTAQTRGQQFDFDLYGGFVQAVIKPTENLKLVPAWRTESLAGRYTNELNGLQYDINDYGNVHQPKLSAVFSLSDHYTLYANYGRTFQVGVGTASYKVTQTQDLDASINEGWETGLRFRPLPWLDGRVAIWEQTASNEARRKLNDPANSSENIGKTQRHGIDIQLNAQATRQLGLWVTAALQRSKILRAETSAPTTRGKEIDHVPHYLVNAGADYAPSDALRLSLWASAQGDYYTERTNSTGRFGQYVLLNASASYRVSPTVRADLQLRNLTDRYYEYVWHDGVQTLHSPGEPRAVFGSLHLSF